MAKLWSYTVGKKGYNRVTVRERYPGGPIQIEYQDSRGRHREGLSTLNDGKPIYDKQIAMALADAGSAAQARKRDAATASKLLNIKPVRRLKDLLSELHEAKEQGWSEKYVKDQKRARTFWLNALGNPPLPVDPARIEKAARIAYGHKPRTHYKMLRYMVDAFYFGQHKLKWLGEADNLSAVTFPKVNSESRPYSHAEMMRLLEHAPSVDLRVAAMLHIAYDSARRANAIRSLATDAYSVEDGVGVIQFPGATDKARKSGRVILTDSGREVVELLLQKHAVQKSGFFFVSGNLDKDRPKYRRITYRQMLKLLRIIEQKAGVAKVAKRAFHGIKHRSATDGINEVGVAAVSGQSGTTEAMLLKRYKQDDVKPKRELATRLEHLKRQAR